MNYLKDGKPTGIVVDLARAMAQRMRHPVEIRLMDWSEAQQRVLNGQADALLQINSNPGRLKLFDFSEPLLLSEFTIFTSAERHGITSKADLRGLKVGVEKKGMPILLVQDDPQILVEIVPNFVQGFRMLEAGGIDAVVVDRWVGCYVLAEYGIKNVKMVERPLSTSYSAIAVKKGNADLLSEINNALLEIRGDGTYDRIVESWKGKGVIFQTIEQAQRQKLLWLLVTISVALLVSLLGIATQRKEIRRRKQSEDALRKSQAMLNMVLDTVPQSIFWKDPEGRYLGCNQVFAAAAGLDEPGQVIGKTDFDLPWPRKEAEAYRADDREVLESNQPKHNIIEPLQQADGVRILIDTTKIPLADENGRPFAVLGVYADITARKLAEQAIQEHLAFLKCLDRLDRAIRNAPDLEHMMRDALDVVLDVMAADRAWLGYLCDPGLEFWCAAMERTRPGWPGISITGERLPVSPDIREVCSAILGAEHPIVFGPGGDRPMAPVLRDQFSVQTQLCLVLHPLLDQPWMFGVHQCSHERAWTSQDKVLLKAMGSRIRDALSSLLFLRQLQESEERFRALVDQAQDAIFVHGPTGRFLLVNQRACEVLGYTREELLGMTVPDVDPDFQMRDDPTAIWGALPQTFETRHKKKDGSTFPVEVRLCRITYANQHVLHAAARDITARKEAERAIQEHVAFLQCLDRLDLAIRKAPDLDLERMMSDALHVVLEVMDADRAWLVYPFDPDVESFSVSMERTRPEWPGALALGVKVPLSPELRGQWKRFCASEEPVAAGPGGDWPVAQDLRDSYSVQSYLAMALHPNVDKPWQFGMHQCSHERVWSAREKALFKAMGGRIRDALNSLLFLRQLRESEERYRGLYQNTPVMLHSIDNAGLLASVSDTWCRKLGYTREEALGRNVLDFLTEESKSIALERSWPQFYSTGMVEDIPYQFITKNGGILDVLLCANAERDAKGNIVRSLAVLADVTKLKRTEEYLAWELAVNRAMSDLSAALISTATTVQDIADITLSYSKSLTQSDHGFVAVIDPKTRDMIAYTLTQMMGKECRVEGGQARIAFPCGPDGRYPNLSGHAMNTRLPFYTNEPAAHAASSGTPAGHIPLRNFLAVPALTGDRLIGCIALANADGAYTDHDLETVQRLAGLYAVAIDREATMAALRTGEQQIRGLFNASTDSVMLLDATAHVLAINAEGSKRRGLSPEDLSGRDLEDILPREAAARRRDALQECARSKQWLDLTEELGDRRYHVRMFPILDQVGEATQFALFSRDVTEAVLAEEALRNALSRAEDLADKAEAANKAKSEFLANMSHEIRTPLNGIMGMLQLLQGSPLHGEQHAYLGNAIRSSKRLTRLLGDILDISMIESGKLAIQTATFGIEDICQSIRDLFSRDAKEKGLALRCAIDERIPPRLVGDEARLRQILFNLVGNAVKFTLQGEVDIAITLVSRPGELPCRVLFSIADTGIGIPEDMLTDIFEPFTQVEGSFIRRYQGAGLGLAIVHRLTRLLGGELCLSSGEGAGTSAHAVFPFATAAQAGTVAAAPEAPLHLPGSLRVLLVEDEKTNLLFMQHLLERSGHAVTTAGDGEQALERLRHGEFDLIVMDVQMPVMDGVEATHAIRNSPEFESKSAIPIIALTAYAMSGDRERFLAAGMDGYLAKPVEMDALAETIAKVMARGRQGGAVS